MKVLQKYALVPLEFALVAAWTCPAMIVFDIPVTALKILIAYIGYIALCVHAGFLWVRFKRTLESLRINLELQDGPPSQKVNHDLSNTRWC